MSSKEHAHRDEKASSKPRAPKHSSEILDLKPQQQSLPATLIQRARLDPGSLTPGEVKQLQRAIGNQMVGNLFGEANKTTTSKSGETVQRAAQDIIQRDFDSDLAELNAKRDAANPGLYRDILTEAINSAARVKAWASVPAGGSAQRRFTASGDVAGYVLNYQADATDATLKIANFVHELTHISVQEAYGSDFVNYANPPKGAVTPPKYGPSVDDPKFGQAVKGIKNEEQRQMDQMNAKANDILLGNLDALVQLVGKSGLTQERQDQVKSKIDYGRINVSKEYDTVLNQIYLWCKGWNADTGTRFFQMLEAMVQDAYNRRQNLEAVTKQVPIPPKQGLCFITTACIMSRGLPDDCEELTVLRYFRDNYLLNRSNGKQLVELYYQYSPDIVTNIDKQVDASSIYAHLYEVIRACVDAIKRGDNEFAYNTYCEMVIKLKEEYIPEVEIPAFTTG